ncbi:hypothetical protein J5N97_013231 [Dioscorea zingiberensis]|uniref:NAC domain-containing protein n=1 Tax=Dioscorea zingiberensis TaxID=325984 RepID=A0A9D5CSK4_9LILI|nr:hypothetical protein J5N97_013231 [Dioscorea zingiberensis]
MADLVRFSVLLIAGTRPPERRMKGGSNLFYPLVGGGLYPASGGRLGGRQDAMDLARRRELAVKGKGWPGRASPSSRGGGKRKGEEGSSSYSKDGKNYYFTLAKRSSPGCSRLVRQAGSGYWHMNGTTKKIYDKHVVLGTTSALTYIYTQQRKKIKTKWVMHEYRVDASIINTSQQQTTELVLCCTQESGRGAIPNRHEDHNGGVYKSITLEENDPRFEFTMDELLGGGHVEPAQVDSMLPLKTVDTRAEETEHDQPMTEEAIVKWIEDLLN